MYSGHELLKCINFVERCVLLDNLIDQSILLTDQVQKLTDLYKDKPYYDILRLDILRLKEAQKKFDDATYLLACLDRNLDSKRKKCEEIIKRAREEKENEKI